MGLNMMTIVCPHCTSTNNITTDDAIWNAEIGCSKCRGIMGLLRDFANTPPQIVMADKISEFVEADETPVKMI